MTRLSLIRTVELELELRKLLGLIAIGLAGARAELERWKREL